MFTAATGVASSGVSFARGFGSRSLIGSWYLVSFAIQAHATRQVHPTEVFLTDINTTFITTFIAAAHPTSSLASKPPESSRALLVQDRYDSGDMHRPPTSGAKGPPASVEGAVNGRREALLRPGPVH